ncbi:MAG: type II restriction endonuclease, partial [Burkholderiaceae bacterium]|nr:type II restriction endonuclease [Burkholderiaceae bacterium]
AQFCRDTSENRWIAVKHFHGQTAFNLSPQKLAATLSERLINWFAHDFDTFRKEVNTAFGVDIPSGDLQLWSDYFEQERNNILGFNDNLAHAESELDRVVYALFGLDEDDIALMEIGW